MNGFGSTDTGSGAGVIAGLLRAVEHGRNLSGRAKAPGFVLALGAALDRVENCFHDLTDLPRASDSPTPFTELTQLDQRLQTSSLNYTNNDDTEVSS